MSTDQNTKATKQQMSEKDFRKKTKSQATKPKISQ